MRYDDIKFKFNIGSINENKLEKLFKEIGNELNVQFDEKFNPYIADNVNSYQFKDLSNSESEDIEMEINNFFNFTFENVIKVPLYKFLVLKNNGELIILAIICSKIFDYTSINDIYGLFESLQGFENKFVHDLDSINGYLSSSDFEMDSVYWKNHLLDIGSYIKYYNIKSNNYQKQDIPLNNNSLNEFLTIHNISMPEFIEAVFSLYLSRIDNTDGSLLKTVIGGKNSLLSVPYLKNAAFDEYLMEFDGIYAEAREHTRVNIENYIGDKISHYSVYDFTTLNDNITVYNGEGDALTLNIYENKLELIYNTDLFSDVYIAHMLDNLLSMIDNILDSPKEVCGYIDILSEAENDLLSSFCKGESLPVDHSKTLAMAFRENASNNPDAIAVDDGVNRVSYGDLEKSSNSIVYDLITNHNIDSHDAIALMIPRNYHYLEMVLSLNKMGIPFIPIDPLYPLNRIEHMLDIGQCDYIISSRVFEGLHDFKVNVIYIEDLDLSNDVNVDIVVNPDNLLAVIFTSGTTGLPKGVMVSNRQLSGLAVSYKDIFKPAPGDVVGYFASFSFIASVRMIVTLYYGECCRIFNEAEQKDSLLLLKALKEQSMSDLILPPSLGVPIFENEDIKLRHLILAGAKLNEISKRDRYTKLVNFYGTTEIIMAITNIIDLNEVKDNRVPIGKPIPNTWVYILDGNRMPLPLGVPGEICVSSDNISPGYFNDFDLTKDVFVDNPHSDCSENRHMYCTGDIGFYNFNGEIEILGRRDDQLSVRGFRIESGEILKVMKSFPSIGDVHLDVDNDILIAYYTLGDDLDISIVKDALRNELPYYMVPSLFVELEKIPLNANGKIDKTALKDMAQRTMDVEISDETLKIVLDGFKEVLAIDSILIDDDFVELGGSSLSAMHLQRVLKDKLDVSLSSSEIVELATPVNIANKIKFSLKTHNPIAVNYSFDERCPLLESQLNVYLDEKVKDMGTAYNNPFKIKFKKEYAFAEFKEAIDKLFDIYPILSARVIEDEGDISFIFDVDPVLTDSFDGDFVKPFDLNSNLTRFSFIEDESIFYADFHHLIFDGTSLNVIVNSLLDILNVNDDVDDVDVDDVDVDDVDVDGIALVDDGFLRQLSFEETNVDDEYIHDAEDLFDKIFVDVDETSDLLASVGGTSNYEFVDTFDIDGDVLNSFLQSHSLTPNQFFASVFAYALSKFTASSKVSFNLIEDGRGHIDLSHSVGMFVRTLPLIVDCENRDIDSFLSDCSSLVNSVMFYDLYPFRFLANKYDLNSSVFFQYSHEIFNNNLNMDKYGFTVDEIQHDAIADLSFFIFNLEGYEFGIRMLYSDKFSTDFIEHFAESYKLILDGMLKSDDLSDFNYMTPKDIEISDAYNQNEHPLSYDDILDAFNDNLMRYPNNKLVSMYDRSYSYGEGAYIADKIAKQLLALGLESGDRVGFLTERSESYVFAVLAILSMGGVYVPVDDNLPDERIAFMLRDSDSKVLIVTDGTYDRAKNLIGDNVSLLNISNILGEEMSSLNNLPVVYGHLGTILYTSGTTGLPKGVKVTRKALLNVSAYYHDAYGLDNEDVYALYPSIGFDVSNFSIACVIYAGACLSVVPEEIRLNMLEVNNYFISQGVGHVIITTQVGKLLMQSIDETSLEVLLLGGEKLGQVDEGEEFILVDAFGPTEAFAFNTTIKNSDKIDYSSVGFLNYNSKAYILDSEKRRVPVGAIGELCFAGYQVAEGYLNRERETADAFIDNPFSDDEDYDNLYRTGDMVRFLSDGSLGFVGRRDGQVKIRGNRVELTEVESVIRDIDILDDVTVQTIKNGDNKELVAYIVLSNDIDNGNSTFFDDFDDKDLADYIRKYVGERKPEYMVPSFVVNLDCIPLTVNGKVDKRALPEVNLDDLHREYVAPETEKEKLIVDAFEKVFNHDKIGIHDDFILLGGDSLTAIKLLAHLESYDITAADVLSLRTPYEIAKKIKEKSMDLDIYSLDMGCPLNEPQLNVYLDIMANDKWNAYHIPLVMDLSDEYLVEDIENALGLMFEVHPILGMCVSDDFDVPYLVKGSKPMILFESDFDKDFIFEFLTRAFDFKDSLCRFLIVGNGDGYNLFAVFHHIIFDASSRRVFRQDLLRILDGESIAVDDSFLRVAAFNKKIEDYEGYADAGDFYESMLCDSEDVGVLLDSVLSDGQGVMDIDLDLDFNWFKSFLERNKVSENVVFTGVFAYTLSRFVGSEKVMFNMVENGRDRFNNFNSIGMFANTLPLLFDCKNQTVSGFMDYVSDLVYGILGYNYYPFRLLANRYDIDSNIIFQFLPDWIEDDVESVSNDSLDYENEFLSGIADLNADFGFEVLQNGNEYALHIIYSDKYSSDLIEHFAESYKLILCDMLNANNLSDINYISKEDIELLRQYNETENDLLYDDILDEFNRNLINCRDNVLVSYGDSVYTYGEGAYIANEIVKGLSDLGVEKQDFVSLFVNRSEWFLLASMGVLAKDGIYVPIETTYPDARITLMLDDSKSRIVIVDDDNEQRMLNIVEENSLDIGILNVSRILDGDIGSLEHLDIVEADNNDIACVLYTSGTTGTPKGVLSTRKAINNFVSWYVDETEFTSDDVYGMHCSYVFDIHVAALYSPIVTGGSLCVVPEDIRLDLKALNDYFIQHNCTHTYITSQVGKLFAESGMDTTIKLLCFGGMKLGELNAPDSIGPFESYGPSENLAISTSIFANKRMHHSSIGRFINNVKGYVLDAECRHVPIGAVGELYLAGYQVAGGYLNRDEETSRAFIENPFSSDEDYALLYRTGDMVRLLPDGSLGIVGRRDSQVKIRGNRVELSEVESVIREIDYVVDVTVQTVKNGNNNELVAYVVLSRGMGDDEIRINVQKHIHDSKPEYMVPSFVIILDSIPLNVNGKVDRKALPAINLAEFMMEYVPPRNEIEQDIVDAFEKIFNQEKIGIYDDFIKLGGDSLTAIKLLQYLGDYTIPVANILRLRTPYAIANSIKDESFDLDIYSLESGCPLSESQLNVYLDILAYNKIGSYLIPLSMKISNEYDIGSISDALKKLLDAHPILSMRVSETQDVPYLINGSEPEILVGSDLGDEFVMEFLNEPFDIHDHLCKFLIMDGEDGSALFGVFHHIVFDALSIIIFERDLRLILAGESLDLDDSFLKVSAFNQQIQDTDDFSLANDFYESMLADSDEAGVLLDNALADGPGNIQLALNLDNNLFRSFLGDYGVSENVVFTSVFAYTLSRFVGSDKVLFNIIENGRDRFNNLNSIGMFVNTLPLLVNCKNRNISGFMEYMSGLIYDVMRYNYYPFRLLANNYDIDSNILFQFLPEWIDDDVDEDMLSNFKENELYSDRGYLISDLNVMVVQKGKNYSINVSFSDKYSYEFVESFIESYNLILEEILCADELGDMNYISTDDIELLDDYNDLPYADVLDAFNHNLAESPNNALVSFNDHSYTYGEGAFIADKLAKELIDLGINSKDCVSFLLGHSELYIFCVLGILSCGGVYVPLDDNLPDKRLEFMLNDAQSKVLIVSDETYRRASDLDGDFTVLNLSKIVNGDINVLSSLPIVYGDLACILYTSGTTGIPKGVKITRKSIVNVIASYVDAYGLGSDDVCALFSAIGFDMSNFIICAAFYAGACLCAIPEDIKLDMLQLNNHFINQGVTHTFITTQVGKLFMQSVEDTSLDVLLLAGEKLGKVESPDNYRLVDGFGPTETFAFISSICNCEKIDPSSVGYLNYNTKAYVLDDEGRRVPLGAVGELCLAGYQIADGYLNRDDENSKSFIDNPFEDDEDYNLLYRTGDMVRLLPDGSLGIVGRRDSQVKIRGNRVELSEIEALIREMDHIIDVTVQTIKNGENNELLAYVVASEGLDDIKDYVCGNIANVKPAYMIPSFVIKLDSIPLTVNGKIDKRALPEVDLDILHAEYLAPRNNIEKQIVNAFEEVFNQEKISIYDDFIKLGGDSLTAIKINSILSENNIHTNVMSILKDKTPYMIARNISKNRDYGFELVRKGNDDQNMFILPPIGGTSFILYNLANSIDFNGNIYLIDDFKYDLTLDEIRNIDDNHHLILDHYYDAIKDLFQDGDIIAGYSLGGVYASLLCERLEKTKQVGKCIFVDMPVRFVNDVKLSREEVMAYINFYYQEEYRIMIEGSSLDFKDKLIEISMANSNYDFHTPKINAPIVYLATTDEFKDNFDDISDNYEFILIDSTHEDIIDKDLDKIVKYFK